MSIPIPQATSVDKGDASNPAPHSRITSLRFRGVLFVMVYWTSNLLRDFQCGLQALARIGRNPQRDLRRLGSEQLLVIPDGERPRAQLEGHFFRFTWRKGNALKAAQGADRLSDTRSLEAEIALHGLDACARPGVGDIGSCGQDGALLALADFQFFIQASRAQLRFVDMQIFIAERCVR